MDHSASENLSRGATSFLFNLKDLSLIKNYDIYVRKAAHIFEYLILALLSYNYFRFIVDSEIKLYIYTFVLSFIYACNDEIHQLFIEGRSGQVSDIFIDMIGVLFVLIIMFIKNRNASKRKSS